MYDVSRETFYRITACLNRINVPRGALMRYLGVHPAKRICVASSHCQLPGARSAGNVNSPIATRSSD